MPRHFASIASSIWDDPDFWELSGEAQRVYLMLISQSSITSCGSLALTLRRWANQTRGCTIHTLSDALSELSTKAYVVIDWDREELLVRSFVRHDHGYGNEKRRAAILSAAKALGSPLLSGVMAFELDRLDVRHDLRASPIDARSNDPGCPIDALSDVPSIAQGSRYVSREHAGNQEPETGNREPGTLAASASTTSSAPPTERPRTADADFDAFWTAYPRKVGKEAARKAWANALRRKRATVAQIISGVRRMADDPNLPDQEFIPHPSTWLTRGGWDDEPFPPRRGAMPQQQRPSTTDARVLDAVALAARYAQHEDNPQHRLEIAQ